MGDRCSRRRRRSSSRAPPPEVEWLARKPDDFAIAEFPVTDGPWAMFWATRHGKRVVTGATPFVPPGLDELAEAENAPDPQMLVTALRSIYPLRYAVVHHPRLSQPERVRWAARLADPPPGLALVERVGEDDIWAVTDAPEAGVDLHRYVSSDYLRGHPNVVFAFALPDRDAEVRQWAEVTFNGRPLGSMDGSAGGIRVAKPYRAADRNDFRFTRHYVVHPAVVAADPSYRVGQTGGRSPVDLESEADLVCALRSVGAKVDLRNTVFVSHALVGIKGARPGEALESSGGGERVIRVGRERWLRLVLERF